MRLSAPMRHVADAHQGTLLVQGKSQINVSNGKISRLSRRHRRDGYRLRLALSTVQENRLALEQHGLGWLWKETPSA